MDNVNLSKPTCDICGGIYPCIKHVNSKAKFEKLGITNNTMPKFFENLCNRLKEL